MKVTITNIYSGTDGESHFRDIQFPLDKLDDGSYESEDLKTHDVVFRVREGQGLVEWHPAPRRQMIVVLKGKFELEIGDGTRRVFGPGEMFLAEDTTGRGHVARMYDATFLRLPVD